MWTKTLSPLEKEEGGGGQRTFPGFILELDDNMTKGEFVNVLKDSNNSEMLSKFLEAKEEG